MCGQPGYFPPDKGRGPAGQSQSSCCGDTFGPTHCLGEGHSEQSHGRRSFHCTSYPVSLISVEGMRERKDDKMKNENRQKNSQQGLEMNDVQIKLKKCHFRSHLQSYCAPSAPLAKNVYI